jgi:hypothetical protein
MKTKHNTWKSAFRQRLLLIPLGLAMIGSTPVAMAQDLIVNTFDSSVSDLDWYNFRSYAYSCTYVWDATQDASGNSNSGAMYFTMNWPLINDPTWNQSWNDVQLAFGTPQFNSADYVQFDCDIKVDVTNSFTALDGSYGAVELIVNNPWNNVAGWLPLSNTNGWQHLVGYFSVLTPGTYQEAVIGLISNGGSAYTNTLAVWIDNIVFTAVPTTGTNQPPLTLAKAPPAGLTCLCSEAAGTWQRAMIATANDSYSWNTATAAAHTTTYAMDIAAFPDAAYSGFGAQMFLIPQAGISDAFGDNSVDWDSANVVSFTVTELANHSAQGAFQYKVNDPKDWTATLVQNLVCATGPLGKWTLSFYNNTNVTITAPDNTKTNFSISASDADVFQDPVYFYVGTQPNQNANIGQSATFSQIQINGSATSLSDNFISGGTPGQPYVLNTNWVNIAASQPGISITAPDAKYWLSWPTPDAGFTNVFITDNLKNNIANNQWLSLPTTATGWLDNGNGRRITVINQSAVNAAFNHSPTNCFFKLYHP